MLQSLRHNQDRLVKTVHSISVIFWALLISGIVIFLLTTTLKAHQKNARLKNYVNSLNLKIERVRGQNDNLQREISAINNDPFYLEMVMRRELNMLQQGEIVIKPARND